MEKMLKDIFYNYSDEHPVYAVEADAKIKGDNEEIIKQLSPEMENKYLGIIDASVETAFFHGYKCAIQLVLLGVATK